MNIHLSQDQIDDQLIGDLAPEPAAHLAACTHCQAAVAEAESPMASFRELSLAWAERRSATMPSPKALKSTAPSHRLAWASLAAAGTAAIAVAVAIPHMRPAGHSQAITSLASVSQTPVIHEDAMSTASDTQVARDNQMLAAIDDALNAPVHPVSFDHRSRPRTNPLRD